MSGLGAEPGAVGAPCEECPVRRRRIFRPFEDSELAFVHNMLVAQRTIRAGTDIILFGESGGPFYTLWKGWAYRYRPVPTRSSRRASQRQIIDFLVSGDLFGLEGALTGEVCHSVRALTEVVVCMHNPRMLSRLFAECPRLMQATMETVIRDFRRADMRLSVVGRMDATQRLAHFLLELYDRMAQRDLVEGDGERFPFPLRRRHLADALGMSGTHVSRSLSELHGAGLVDITDGFLVIRNREGLADLSGYRAYDGMGRQAIL